VAVIEHLVELRGFLHHHSIKNKKAWNPSKQSDFKGDALFWQSVCHEAAIKSCTEILYRAEELEKFLATPVLTPEGHRIRWNPAPDES
jgi:hypothetical protein